MKFFKREPKLMCARHSVSARLILSGLVELLLDSSQLLPQKTDTEK